VTKPLRSFSDLEELIERTGFTKAGPRIRRLAWSCWHVMPDQPDFTLIGDSRLGGSPVLAEGSTWPRSNDGYRLAFFGQLRLSEIARLEPASGLPASGLLSLFADPNWDFPIEAVAVLTQVGTTVERLARPPKGGPVEELYLKPVTIRFEPGLSFPIDRDGGLNLKKEDWPEGDFNGLYDALYDCICTRPKGQIGQLLGHCPWGDLRPAVYFEAIGRPGQEHLWRWESWEAWEEAKKMRQTFWGHVYQPAASRDDENVRWILENQSAISAGIEQWRFLLSIESNKHMDLWMGDSILFFAPLDESGRMDLSRVKVWVTQS
jgi:hypothetical protein